MTCEGTLAGLFARELFPSVSGKRSRSWVTVKFNRRQEFVVGGYKPNASGFESLLVGYYEGRKLMFASKVRAGLTPHTRADLFPTLKVLVQPKCPFANLPSSKTGHWDEGISAEDMTTLRWVKPQIVVEVSFVEWTRDGLLRHPQFIGVRVDKSLREVRRDQG